MFDVKLPAMLWFENGNIYTGSLLTDPQKGIMNKTTLDYSVKLVEENSAKVFCAVCRFKLPREVKTNIEEYTLAFFEGSEKGKRIIENWITRQVFSPNIRVKEIQETRQTFNKMLISSDESDDKRNNEYHKVLIAKNETSEEIK